VRRIDGGNGVADNALIFDAKFCKGEISPDINENIKSAETYSFAIHDNKSVLCFLSYHIFFTICLEVSSAISFS
jgi:hypothetical protein